MARVKNRAAKQVLVSGQTNVTGSTVKDFLNAQINPQESRGVLCPFSHNNEPSIRATPGTTSLVWDIDVAPNTTSQLSFFPGHALPVPTNGMDPVSFHTQPLIVGSTYFWPGPIDCVIGSTTYNASCANILAGLPLNYCNEDASSSTYRVWDQKLPYIGVVKSGHSRWQLVSMSLQVTNNTRISDRGGSITTVQKTNNNYISATAVSQAAFSSYPSYKVWGNRDVKITKTLRSEDMAMWHVPDMAGSDTSLRAATLKCFLNNHSATTQSYTATAFFNWQLAGDLFGTVATPLFTQPSSLMDSVTSIMQNYFPSAQMTGRVFEYIQEHGWDHIGGLLSKLSYGGEHSYAHLMLQ
jgi:hypothetical protein